MQSRKALAQQLGFPTTTAGYRQFDRFKQRLGQALAAALNLSEKIDFGSYNGSREIHYEVWEQELMSRARAGSGLKELASFYLEHQPIAPTNPSAPAASTGIHRVASTHVVPALPNQPLTFEVSTFDEQRQELLQDTRTTAQTTFSSMGAMRQQLRQTIGEVFETAGVADGRHMIERYQQGINQAIATATTEQKKATTVGDLKPI